MKVTNTILKQFNDPSVTLVVSAWPEKIKGKERNHGIAWYTKMITEAMASDHNKKFVILAEQGLETNHELLYGNRVLVLRVFNHRHVSLYPTILKYLKLFPKIQHVMVHSEFGVNTGLIHYALLLPFLFLIRLTGKKITYVAHNVVTDISFLANHLHLPEHPWMQKLLNVAVQTHTKLLGLLSSAVWTLDSAVYTRVSKLIPLRKVAYFPIPVEQKEKTLTQVQSKIKLGITPKDTVILSFGFISAYKGSDWIVQAFDRYIKEQSNKNIHLILAGGPADSHKEKPYYQEYYRKVVESVAGNTQIRLTGFVPEKDIQTYFAAADLVVMPYRGLMGGSGALTFALSHHSPVLLSTAMRDITNNIDIKQSMHACGISQHDIFFPLTKQGMKKIIATAQDQTKKKTLRQWSGTVGTSRSLDQVTQSLYDTIRTYEQTQTVRGSQPRVASAYNHNA